jgi:hypothetical protein
MNSVYTEIGYEPHAGQLQFHDSDARFKVLIAGARFGKSLAASKDVLRDLLSSQTRGWLVGPTFALTQPELEYLVLDATLRLGLGITAQSQGKRGDHSFVHFENGSEVHCMSAQRPQALLGREVDWMILCEAAHLDRDAYERFLRARLATREGRLLVPTTPHGHNWIKSLYDKGIAPGSDWQSFRFATWDNPRIAAAEVEAARAELSQEVFDEQFGGAFVARAGRVYPEFERAVHVQACEPQAGAQFWHGIDFGFTNPFVCLWAALDHDDRLCVLDEYHCSSQTLDVHAREIKRRDEALIARGLLCAGGVADPAGRVEREELVRQGINLGAAENALLAGIDAVRQRLKPRQDGTRGMLIDPCCANLVRELEGYCYDKSASETEPLPLKREDHCLDALRYVCMALSRRVDWRGVRLV